MRGAAVGAGVAVQGSALGMQVVIFGINFMHFITDYLLLFFLYKVNIYKNR